MSLESEKVRKLSSLIIKAWKWEFLEFIFKKIDLYLKSNYLKSFLRSHEEFLSYQLMINCTHNVYLRLFPLQFSANYDPNEDEYYRANGHVINGGEITLDNNNQPITVQPSARIQRHNSSGSSR